MSCWQTNFYVFPKPNNSWVDIDLKEVIQKVDSLISRTDQYSSDNYYWKSKGIRCDNDGSLRLNKDSQQIEYFMFRVDNLNDLSLGFLNDMVLLCESFDLVVKDSKDDLVTLPLNVDKYLNSQARGVAEIRKKRLEGIS